MSELALKAGQVWTVKVTEAEGGGVSLTWELAQPSEPVQALLGMPRLRLEPPMEFKISSNMMIMARGAWRWSKDGILRDYKLSAEEEAQLLSRMERKPELMSLMLRHGQRAYKLTKIGYSALGAAYAQIASHDEVLAQLFFEDMVGTVREHNENAPIPRWIREQKIGPFAYPWRSAVLTLLEFYEVFVAEQGNVQEHHIEGVLQRVQEKM